MIKSREEILEDIKELADEEYKNFHSGLCPETNNILGVRVPLLRNYAKKLVDEDWKTNYNNIGDEYYEEIMLKGMILGLAKMELEERLTYLEKFVPQIDNWSVCDVTCAGLKFVKKHEEKVFEFLKKYLESDREFEIRFAIVMLLNYFVTEKYVDSVIQILDNVKHLEYYYVKMAVAWALSIIYIKYPEKATEYLKGENKLNDETYNKALQKIIESNRVSKKEKNKIRKMKRNKSL
ncbi:MAG: DNA alkylation repair protein [Clostridia bacterium]